MKKLKIFLSTISLFVLGFHFNPRAQVALEADINPGPSGSVPGSFMEFGGKLYFAASDGVNGKELWSYDGTTAMLAADIIPGAAGSTPAGLTEFNGKLYFTANDGIHGNELWSYDGTTAMLEADIYPGSSTSNGIPNPFLAVFGGKLYFPANDGVHGIELWSFDGTTVGLVADINSGAVTSNPNSFAEFNGKLYFAAGEGVHGTELWSYDGTTVTLVADIYPGSAGSAPHSLTVFGGKLYFSAQDGVHGYELFSYNGTTVTLEADINPTSSSAPNYITGFGGKLYFNANEGVHGYELWSYDGTTATLVADINPGGHGNPLSLTEFDGKLYFTADDGVHGYELWSCDGTTATLVRDIYPGSVNGMYIGTSYTGLFSEFSGKLYFSANAVSHGIELWSFTPCPAAGTACDDGDACTTGDVEDGNCNCAGTPVDCDDNDLCTTDACSNGACVNTPINCDDNDPCTTDACSNGSCQHTPVNCDDNNLCTTDACVNGSCVFTPITCDDGNACTTDACVNGTCVFTPTSCDDGNPNTVDVCYPASGCAHETIQAYDIDRTYGENCGVTNIATLGGSGGNTFLRASFHNSDGTLVNVYQLDGSGIAWAKLDANGQLLSTSFYSGGDLKVNDVAVDDNGKIFVVGSWTNGAYILCLDATGTATYYRNSDDYGGNTAYYGVVTQPDGKAICWGKNGPANKFVARRYNTDGTLDNSYGGLIAPPTGAPILIGNLNTQGRAIIQSNGKAVFCWQSLPNPSIAYYDYFLVRLETNGQPDSTFGFNSFGAFSVSGFTQTCQNTDQGTYGGNFGFRRSSGDKMRIGGAVVGCPAGTSGRVMQLTADGLPDNSFGTNGIITFQYANLQTFVPDIAVDPATDKTYAVGGTRSGNGCLVYRINSNGTLDNTFNGTGYVVQYISSIYETAALVSSNKLLVGWNRGSLPGVAHNAMINETDAMFAITTTADCPNVQLKVNDVNLTCFSWQWYKNGLPISGATDTSYTATENGNYYVTGSYTSPPNPVGLDPGTSTSDSINVIVGPPTWYLDADGDHYYVGSGITQCASPGAGYVSSGLIGGNDCDDNDAARHVGCNGQPIPTLSEWGLIIFTLLLLCFGTIAVWNERYGKAYSKF